MYKLGDKFIDNCGSKAKLLSMLKSRGYNIPLGVVIEFEEFKNIIKTQNLNIENINEIEIPDDLINRIFDVIPQGKNYAIRSSININDVRNKGDYYYNQLEYHKFHYKYNHHDNHT